MNQNKTKKTILINSAKTIFIEKGYDQTTVEEICTLAGVAKGTFFYYFETKQHIIYEMLRGQISDIKRDFLRELSYATSPLEKLDLALDIVFSSREKQMESVLSVIGEENGWAQAALAEIKLDMLYPIFSEIIFEGKSEGIFGVDNVDITCCVLLSGLNAYYNKYEDEFSNPKVCKSIFKGVDEIINKILDINLGGRMISTI